MSKFEDVARLCPVVMALIVLLGTSSQVNQAEAVEIDLKKLAGWQATGEMTSYPPDKLWEVINGAAEQYQAYGVQQLRTVDLGRDDIQVTFSLFDMGSPLNAYGIYRVERYGDTEESIGTAASLTPPYQALLVKDRYYVKVEAFQGELGQDAGHELLAAVAEQLPGSDSLPAELNRLPRKNQVAGSATYTATGYLGIRDLNHCVNADYILADAENEDREYKVFILLPRSKATPTEVWRDLSKTWESVSNAGGPMLKRTIPYTGTVGLFITLHGLSGIVGAETPEEIISVASELGMQIVNRY